MKNDDSICIIKVSGGEYEDAWTHNLFAVASESTADILVKCFEQAQTVYESLVHNLDEFKSQYNLDNPSPEIPSFYASEKFPEPQPTPHPSLKSFSRKDKKRNPLQIQYLKELREYEGRKGDFLKDARMKYELASARYREWDNKYTIAYLEFETTNIMDKCLNCFPPEFRDWSKMVNYMKYIRNQKYTRNNSFNYEVIDVITA